MYCPNCGEQIPDEAKFCGKCGAQISDFTVDEQEETDPGKSGGNGKRRRNILIIVIVAACAVAAILVFWFFFRIPDEDTYIEDEYFESIEDADAEGELSLSLDGTEVEAPGEEEDLFDTKSAIPEDTSSEVTEEAVPAYTADGSVEYGIQTMEVSDNATYDLVVLDGSNSANQAINLGFDADMQKFDGSDHMQNDAVSADVLYDNNGILSVQYLEEAYESGAAQEEYSVYGLTYNLSTGEEQSMSALCGLDDTELLDKIKTSMKEWWAADSYNSGADAQIDALTLDDFESGYTDGEKNSFVVEGGEIVLLIQPGYLAPILAGYLKIPSGVYISGMHYDFDVDYIIPDSSVRYLTREDIEGLSKEELRIARNEIFARHNRSYKDEPLNNYFSSKSWYNGTIPADEFSYDVFNDFELKNLQLLNEYDQEKGYQ